MDEGNKVISVFCSNFSDRVKAEDLFALFGCVGKCVDVAISPRRNKWGKRFGFGSFREDGDARLLVVRLDAIQIDGVKIYANIPRFETKEAERVKVFGGSCAAEPRGVSEGFVAKKSFAGGASLRNDGGRTIAEVVADQREVVVARKCDFEYKTDPGVKALLIKITPLGANLCLLEEEEEGDIEALIKEAESWWKQWFDSIRPWNELDVDSERRMWIRFFGLPCHTWRVDFFEKLVQSFGTYICSDELVTERSGMEVARVLVCIPVDFMVPIFVNVKVDGVDFRLRSRKEYTSLCKVARKEVQAEDSESEDSVSVGDVLRCSDGFYEEDAMCRESSFKEVVEEDGALLPDGDVEEPVENPAVNETVGIPRQGKVTSQKVIIRKEPFSFDQAIVAAKGKVCLSNSSTGIKETEEYVAFVEGSGVKGFETTDVLSKGLTSEEVAGKRIKRVKFKKVGCKSGPKGSLAHKDAAYGGQSEESLILRNNSRLKENFGYNAGKKLWKLLSDLGVEKPGAEDCVVELDHMEIEERNCAEARMENKIMLK
ncbi:uncharacterized protein LOC131657893 [Vicia villosa]|uniref:uncharacterized protein LOC131657893 n=1 Tax=Vicia villosa TaxID=3911 RepID=UPI00273AC854|nr:uncharacterized protein LOC131657893 [Vicia villosa]